LLDGILGARDVTQDPMRDDEQPVSLAASDGGVGLLVPGPCRLDEGEVHPSGSLLRGPCAGRFIHFECRFLGIGLKIVARDGGSRSLPDPWEHPSAGVARRRGWRRRGGPIMSAGVADVLGDVHVVTCDMVVHQAAEETAQADGLTGDETVEPSPAASWRMAAIRRMARIGPTTRNIGLVEGARRSPQ
jgi:hypothetical protein